MTWAHTHIERVRFGDLDAYESGQTVPLPDALKERLR